VLAVHALIYHILDTICLFQQWTVRGFSLWLRAGGSMGKAWGGEVPCTSNTTHSLLPDRVRARSGHACVTSSIRAIHLSSTVPRCTRRPTVTQPFCTCHLAGCSALTTDQQATWGFCFCCE
jgi:hypothetical protein